MAASSRLTATPWGRSSCADGWSASRWAGARRCWCRARYLGDVYPSGTAFDYRRRYVPVYGRLAEITSPTTGNHGWANRRSGYQPYWRRVTGRWQPPWYAFELGGGRS